MESTGFTALTSDMLAPITEGVTANLGVIVPVGVAILAILIGIALVPRVISKFGGKH